MQITALLPILVLTAAAHARPQESTTPAVSPGETGGAALLLRLRDGSTHWGTIAEHDPDGVRFERLGDGGVARVPWGMLDPVQERELRETFGYVDVSTEELTIPAESIELHGGEEIVGVIVSREGDQFLVKVGGNLQAIPKSRVRAVTGGLRVPALDVYEREEIYARELARADPEDATSQYELARLCERILDFGHAAEHYAAALALDPERRADEIAFALERAKIKAAQQEQIDFLREVDTLRKRGRYDEALERVRAFASAFPGSLLVPDAKRKETLVLAARDDAISELVRQRWHYWLARLARRAAVAEGSTYAKAVEYAEEGLAEQIRANVLADVQERISPGLDADDVARFWEQRDKRRWRLASYGLGTWLLGEEQALAGEDTETEAEREPEGELATQRAELEEKIERFLRNQTLARDARTRSDSADEYEEFWRTFPPSGRAQWIRARYAETSGDVEVHPRPRFGRCPSCGGTGVREVLYTGGGGTGSGDLTLIRCTTCHGIGAIRRIQYR